MKGHVLYTPQDFKGVDEDDATCRLVVEGGLAICKVCGAGEIELDVPCEDYQRGVRYEDLRKDN